MKLPDDLSSIKYESDNKPISESDIQINEKQSSEVKQVKKYAINDVKNDVSSLRDRILSELDIESPPSLPDNDEPKRKSGKKKTKNDDIFDDIDSFNSYGNVKDEIGRLKDKIFKDNS